MPIRPEFREFYTGPAWEATRERIIERAGRCCERCEKPHQKWVLVTRDGTGRWNQSVLAYIKLPSATTWLVEDLYEKLQGNRQRRCALWAWRREWQGPKGTGQQFVEGPERGRVWLIRRSLTVAHLNHTPGDDRDENLAALCEGCHLRYDMEHHRQTRAARKDAERPLLVAVERERELQRVVEMQASARDNHVSGQRGAWLGVCDAHMEEVFIRGERQV